MAEHLLGRNNGAADALFRNNLSSFCKYCLTSFMYTTLKPKVWHYSAQCKGIQLRKYVYCLSPFMYTTLKPKAWHYSAQCKVKVNSTLLIHLVHSPSTRPTPMTRRCY